MTVSATSRKQIWDGSGSDGPFTFNFRILDSTHIILTRIDADGVETVLETPADYSIELVDLGQSGGTITLTEDLEVGETLVVEGATPLSQATGFSNQGSFFPESHEAAFDKLTLITQELNDKFTRSLRIPTADEDGFTVTLPIAAERADKFLAFDEDGNVSVSSFSVSTSGQLPWFTPTTAAPTIGDVGLGMYKVSAAVLGFAANDAKAFEITNPASAVNYSRLQGAATGNYPALFALGANATVGFDYKTKGTTTTGSQYNGLNAETSGRHRFWIEGKEVLQLTDTYWNPNVSYTSTPDGFVVISSGTDTGAATTDIIAGVISVESSLYGQLGSNGSTVDGLTLMLGAKGPTGSVHFLGNGLVGHVSIAAPANAAGDDEYAAVNSLWLKGSQQGASQHPTIFTNGETNVGLKFYTGSGIGKTTFLGHNTATSLLELRPVSTSAIHGFYMNASATGAAPLLGVGTFNGYTSADTNVGLNVSTRGSGSFGVFSGDGATQQFQVTHTASSVNYLSATGAATTAAPKLLAAGSDTNIGLSVASKGTGVLSLMTNSTVEQVRVNHIASAVNYLALSGAATGNGVPIVAAGSDTNVSMYFGTQGTGGFNFYTNSTVLQLQIAHTASAVNYPIISGNVTGNPPALYMGGSDTNIGMRYSTKGTGTHSFYSGTLSRLSLQLLDVASSVNYMTISGSATGSAIAINAQGSDTDVDIALIPKGAGVVKFGTRSAIAAETVTGYITIKDSGGTSRKIAVVS